MQNRRKLNQLFRELPEGLVVDAQWLERHGYYRSLRQKYVHRGWLEQPTRGVYRRPNSELTWEQVVISLQAPLEQPVVIGGRTALELQGFGHYLAHDRNEVQLYGDQRLPNWLHSLQLPQHFVEHKSTRLFSSKITALTGQELKRLRSENRAAVSPPTGLTTFSWGHQNWSFALSTPERAVLELLDELPQRESFHQVDKIIESLVTLSPTRMQRFLEECKNIKVKRLFFFFADRHPQAWLGRINRKKINLGSGKRSLVPNGQLDPTYNITVPKDLDAI